MNSNGKWLMLLNGCPRLIKQYVLFLFFIAACAFRYNGLSFVYLIYLLLIPLFPEPTKITMQGKMFLVSFFRMCGGHSTRKNLWVVEGEVLTIFLLLNELTCNAYCKFPDTVVPLYAGFGSEGSHDAILATGCSRAV